jgi:O-acetyl-ADP-ribose deacetylase (regulator of RNase III)
MNPRVLVNDMFKSNAQTLVNTVNTVGVMGKGIALEFKRRYPDMYTDYVLRCQRHEVRLGQPYLFRRATLPWIVNFPTKQHWRSVSRLQDIVQGLEYLEGHYRDWGITSLAVPPLGCGEGQLEWRVVGRTLYRHLSRFDIPVELFAPYGTPREELDPVYLQQDLWEAEAASSSQRNNRIEPAWIALVEVVRRVLREPYHWPVGRITFQKMAYFATELGIPTGLEYRRGSFGPFAPKLKQLETRLVNNGLIVEEQRGRMFAVKPGPTFEDARLSYSKELTQWESVIDDLVDLFLRVSTTEAEVAATVHFAARSLRQTIGEKPTEREVLAEVMRWKQRRRPPLDERDVAATIRHLSRLRKLDIRPSEDLPLSETALVEVGA